MLVPILLAATVVTHRLPPMTDGECDEFRIRHEVTIPRFTLRSREASQAINDFIDEHARDAVDYDDEAKSETCDRDPGRVGTQTIDCEAGLVTNSFVGVHCHASADVGAHPTSWPESYNFEIVSNHIRELEIDDFFIDNYQPILREELRRAVAAWEHKYPDAAHLDGDIIRRLQNASLGAKSIIFTYDLDSHVYQTVEIPYSRLRRILRPAIWRVVHHR